MAKSEHKKMLDATQGLKNVMGRHFLAIEQAHRDGTPTAWATAGTPVELLYTMDVQPMLPENSATISAALKKSQHFIELAEDEGYSYDLCSYFKKKFKELEIPYLFIEMEYNRESYKQLQTRFQAFAEMI